jgi:type IV pilus assembly protein PilY1
MNTIKRLISSGLQTALIASSLLAGLSTMAVTFPTQPLTISPSAKPLIMLALGRDHRMFYEAYNDASDINGDGTLDTRFKPSITYLGLFNSKLCYTHSGANDSATHAGLFSPSFKAGDLNICSGQWSGNWLNYVTTSRIDALRVVLYGGTREVDTGTQTILRRAYIPQDAHSWGKEYNATDGYRISDYTPLRMPDKGKRHLFGSLTQTAGINCATLSTCSNRQPWLSVIQNSGRRIWDWASKEQPVLGPRYGPSSTGGPEIENRSNYAVRVEVCTVAFPTDCKFYPNGNAKPTGLLHNFGENESALFGLFSGSYDSHLSGGRLRKVISSFKDEVNVNTDGTFIAAASGIVKNLDSFRIQGFNNGNSSNVYKGSVVGNRPIVQGEFPDWGNPVAELMYEATRYLANKGVATPAYIGSTTLDDAMGLSKPAWDKPYGTQGTSTANAPYCARANLLTISDINISYDSDQLPGVNSFGTASSGISTDLNGKHIANGSLSSLNVSAVADFISANESGISGLKFIGQSGSVYDSSPRPKIVGSLSNIRGLAPEEPTKQGSYYAASVAHYAKVNDLNLGLKDNQTVDNFFVALASPLPRIEAKVFANETTKTISLVPYAKSVRHTGSFPIAPDQTGFQPTNQIVDFYVDRIANSGSADYDQSINGGRYEAVFRINYEDVEQGNDHDMDAIVVYTIRANADGTLDVIVQPIYEAGGVKHRMGYIISGTTRDGNYLVVQDESDQESYFLNVPQGRFPGYCEGPTPPGDCRRLPYIGGTAAVGPVSSSASTHAISSFTFSPDFSPTSTVATFLKDPLWYAAKWGGFTDINNDGKPDLLQEWDYELINSVPVTDGLPDTYFFVQNPTKLKDSLNKALTKITDNSSSSSNLASNSSGRVNAGTLIYRASYLSGKWTGEVDAISATATGLNPVPVWSAQDNLPVWTSRNLFMHTSDSTVVNINATTFGALPTADQTSLVNAGIYAYIKGDKSAEISAGGIFRNRESVLGDIIHSSPVYDADTETLYVGSNDGMLHAFDGRTGVERFGMIPRQVVPRLKNLADIGYRLNHEYFVDGDILLGLKFAETNSTRYLYSLLGRGGKGLFSINPNIGSSPALPPAMLWEYTPLASASAAADPDLGFMLSRPLFTKLNNGKIGIVVGNGYNSTNGKAVLYIFMVNPDGSLFAVKKLDTLVGGDNGMAGATFYDKNGDLTADALYAGDLKGNLWRFDISDSDPNNWKLTYSSGEPLFKATDSAGLPQPITAPAYSVFNNFGTGDNLNEVFVYFGTGAYMQTADKTNLNVQSWYGIIDDVSDGVSTQIPSTTPFRSSLVERTISTPYTTTVSVTVRDVSTATVADMANKRGFYLDFKNPVNGERIITSSQVRRDTTKPSLIVTSFYPVNDDICVPGGDSYVNAVDPFTGASLGEELFVGLGNASSLKLDVGIAGTPLFLGTSGTGPDPKCSTVACETLKLCEGNACNLPNPPPPDCKGDLLGNFTGSSGTGTGFLKGCVGNKIRGRISWREIIKD